MTHYKQLDSLRFFAVLAVIVSHWISWISHNVILNTFPFRHGVMLFFVLSGFLITEILLRQKGRIEQNQTTYGRELKNFYARRTLRIFPVYFVVLFVLYYVDYRTTRESFLYLSTYTTNIYMAYMNNGIEQFFHYWSLAVEEQFYIVWPFLIFLIPTRHLLKVILVVILLSILSQTLYIRFFPFSWCATNYQTHNVMYSLGLGGLLACLKSSNSLFFARISGTWILTPLFFCVFVISFYLIVYQNSSTYVVVVYDNLLFCVFAFFLLARAVGPGFNGFGKAMLENRVFSHLGKLSYAIYLVHVCVPDFCVTFYYSGSKEVNWAIWFAATILVAQMSYWIIEKPFNNLKRFFV